ncbi:hypothetical protein EYC80_005202 [Monilinia laxa]|uniref:Transmembrane protein n=1 Tax=Monilinia laxa TaxID=61186 RepID=A0A5N6KKV2_MONLA|nr:hypothetical protein EYC80_005202 [Monilinia laxa]
MTVRGFTWIEIRVQMRLAFWKKKLISGLGPITDCLQARMVFEVYLLDCIMLFVLFYILFNFLHGGLMFLRLFARLFVCLYVGM